MLWSVMATLVFHPCLNIYIHITLQAGVKPSTAVWNTYLGIYAEVGDVDKAFAIWTRMLRAGLLV